MLRVFIFQGWYKVQVFLNRKYLKQFKWYVREFGNNIPLYQQDNDPTSAFNV